VVPGGILHQARSFITCALIYDTDTVPRVSVDQEGRVGDIDDLVLSVRVLRPSVILQYSEQVLLAGGREVRIGFVHQQDLW